VPSHLKLIPELKLSRPPQRYDTMMGGEEIAKAVNIDPRWCVLEVRISYRDQVTLKLLTRRASALLRFKALCRCGSIYYSHRVELQQICDQAHAK
jgi:hypothetical protein